jgi:membrane-associated phospholipid phosphatase
MKDIYTTDKKRRLWLSADRAVTRILIAIAFLLILFLVWVVFIHGKPSFDEKVFSLIAPHVTAGRTRSMLIITYLANPAFLIPAHLLLLFLFLLKKYNWLALRVGVIGAGGLLIKLSLKQLFHRIRPDNSLIEGGVNGFSFPSGHAMMGVAFYGFLIWLTAYEINNKWLQRTVIFLLALLILLISFSRIYLRVHYVTDVIAGICAGIVWLSFCLWFIDKKQSAALAK